MSFEMMDRVFTQARERRMMSQAALPWNRPHDLLMDSFMGSFVQRGADAGLFLVSDASLARIKDKARAALIERAVRMLPARDQQHFKMLVRESPEPLVEMTVCGRCLHIVAVTRGIYAQLHAEVYK